MLQAMTGLSLIGGGGHALVVLEAAAAAGWDLAGVYDDSREAAACRLGGLRHLGMLSEAFVGARLITLGGLASRRVVIAAFAGVVDDDEWTTVLHPAATVSKSARIDQGGFVGAGAIVQAFAVVGPHAIINTGAIVEHECELGENVHLAPGAILAGHVRVGSDTLIGMGARVLPGVTIGRSCTIGAGAVVVQDVPNGAIVVGVPGRRRT